MTEDDIRDIAIRIVDELVLEGVVPDCIDTNNETEFIVQDIIVTKITEALEAKPNRTIIDQK